MADGDSLMVKTAIIDSYGNSLIAYSSILDTKLAQLESKMNTLSGAWKDDNSPVFISNFSKFITDAKTIDADLKDLGNFLKEMAEKYDLAVSNALSRME